MTTHVDSNASGANDGTSWADAYASLGSATGVAAGEEIWIEDGHSETFSAGTTLNFSNGTKAAPVKILCIDSSDDSISTGAVIQTTNSGHKIHVQGICYWYGVTINHERDLHLGNADRNFQVYENCTLYSTFNSANSAVALKIGQELRPGFIRLLGCTINSDANNPPEIYSDAEFCDCGFSSNATTVLSIAGDNNAVVLVSGSDLSLIQNIVSFTDSGTHSRVTVRGCKLHASYAVPAMQNEASVLLERCDTGSITVPPLGLTEYETYQGTIQSSLTRYRTGGADDGEQANAHSWEMATNANAEEVFSPLIGLPMSIWVAGGASITLTVYVASGAILNDDDFWIEIDSPDETASPNQDAETNHYSSRMVPRSTPAALTTDASSTWNGTGVGTKQEVSRTFTPTEAGPVLVRPFLAKPSTTVYVDPKIEVT